MTIFEFEILWGLGWAGDHPRTASDISKLTIHYGRPARSIGPTLRSMEMRGLLRRVGRQPTLWEPTLRGREVVSL